MIVQSLCVRAIFISICAPAIIQSLYIYIYRKAIIQSLCVPAIFLSLVPFPMAAISLSQLSQRSSHRFCTHTCFNWLVVCNFLLIKGLSFSACHLTLCMMAAAAASRIEAACALVNAAQPSPLHADISKRQKLALLKVLKNCKLPVEQLPGFLQQLTSTQWCSDDLNELVNALQNSINVGEMEDDIDSQPSVPAMPGGQTTGLHIVY